MPQSEAELRQLLAASKDDKAERKRLLGLLAQRRYRLRKKSAQSSPAGPATQTGESNSSLDERPLEVWPDISEMLDDETASFTDIMGPGYTALERSMVPYDPPEPADEIVSRYGINETAAISYPILDMLKAHIGILKTIYVSTGLDPKTITVWDPFMKSPFVGSTPSQLPDNYYPTDIQTKVAHHPLYDLLPWPAVRDKILGMLILPESCRPENMRGAPEEVVMKFKYDTMDHSEGIRIHGLDPFDPRNWEIGQRVFERWWWAFDIDIVRNSNTYRERRGVDALKLRKT